MPKSPRWTCAVAETSARWPPVGSGLNPGHFDRRRHLPGDAVQRQLAVDDPAVAGVAGAGGVVVVLG